MKKFIKDLIPYIVITIIVVLIRTFLVTPVIVSGDSMVPTLDNKQLLLLNKINYQLSDIKRFDIVVIKYKDSSGKSELIIKRVIGLPGETISYDKGKLYINGKYIKEKFSHAETIDFGPVTLDDDEYFVMGDNRTVSLDSRYIGPIKIKDIRGRTIISIYPFNKFGKSDY